MFLKSFIPYFSYGRGEKKEKEFAYSFSCIIPSCLSSNPARVIVDKTLELDIALDGG